jgi:hypothetical protein
MKRIKLSFQYLKKIDACHEAIAWMHSHKERDIECLYRAAFKNKDKDQLNWGNWLICRLLNHKQQIQYAVYAAKQVLHLYEEKYPEDKRPRKAINAALKVIKNPSQENKEAAGSAAGDAGRAA